MSQNHMMDREVDQMPESDASVYTNNNGKKQPNNRNYGNDTDAVDVATRVAMVR